ncbi:hypothetical protein cypCar_00020734 [Cyprinus carpio]|uniref:Uncharacterized protein LOC109072841 n=1 Tax=Cyprinus carpio TaxID=7962 RepID=A0A9Q9V6N3_CYPCA|nr:uncharacterized protein LOC109072841 [Cyprinus carpio]XP_018944594.1 uncharacterized protein LOC109072841 [Cyprinus carpio]KTF81922.1 hypothetical protein cypCar_00020734 [Cyprinus carpio]
MVNGTLNELPQIKHSGFGQPMPRHGLNLLYWFAHDYIDFRNGEIVSKYTPRDKRFGFHKFENDDDDPIVPRQNLPYYEVGNLNSPGADELPDYVRAKYNQNILDSNKDRIIVCQDTNGNFSGVYVTEHLKHDLKLFDSSRTYCVSLHLLETIKNMSQEQFLKQTSNTQEERASQPRPSNTKEEDDKSRVQIREATAPKDNSCSCTIL